MFNPFTKAARYLRREHPENTAMTSIGMGIGAVGAAIAVAMGAPLFVIPIAIAGSGAYFGGVGAFMGMSHDRPSENTVVVNNLKVVGDKDDVASVFMTQKLIDKLTEKQKHLPELPAKLQKKIMMHVKDVEPKLARVRIYTQFGDTQYDTFSFRREMVNGKGQTVTQDVATVYVVKPEIETPAAAEPARAETPKPVVAPASPAPEFGALAKKVEAVEKRVEELENPAPAVLDKPKLANPSA